MGIFDLFKDRFSNSNKESDSNTKEWKQDYESFVEFQKCFQQKSIRISFLESFFLFFENERKKLREQNKHNFLRSNESFDLLSRYNSSYKDIMRIYFRNRVQMIDDVRQTIYYQKLDDKSDFEESHRDYGNEILGRW